jgi:hypothetical protein
MTRTGNGEGAFQRTSRGCAGGAPRALAGLGGSTGLDVHHDPVVPQHSVCALELVRKYIQGWQRYYNLGTSFSPSSFDAHISR